MEQVRAVDRVIREVVLLDLAGETLFNHVDRLADKHGVHCDYVLEVMVTYGEISK